MKKVYTLKLPWSAVYQAQVTFHHLKIQSVQVALFWKLICLYLPLLCLTSCIIWFFLFVQFVHRLIIWKWEIMCMQNQKQNAVYNSQLWSKQTPITIRWFPFMASPLVHCCHWSEREVVSVVTSHWWSRTLQRHQVHRTHQQNVHYVDTWDN